MNLEELEIRVKTLEDRIRTLEDIEEIQRLMRIYGYYLDNRMDKEILDLFSDDTESVEIGGVYIGKKGVERCFRRFGGGKQPYGQMTLHAIQQPVISVDGGGKTAKGRWRVVWASAVPVDGEIRAIWGHGHYENEYIKEQGKWKFKKFALHVNYRTTFEEGWVKRPVAGLPPEPMEMPEEVRPDLPPTTKSYPSTDFFPFHYKHPITGK